MNIKYKEYSTVEFQIVKVGDCFKYGGVLYLKIRSSSSNDNAFNMVAENVQTIHRTAEVIPINMVLVEE